MYKVIKFFTDLQDGCHHYEVGDTYPREGAEVSDKRIAELAGYKNRQKTPLIEEVAEIDKDVASSVDPDEYKEADTTSESPEEVVEKPEPKRGRKPKAKEE